MPGEGSVFKTPGGNKRIHDIQASDMKYFFDCYLHMPGSIFRFHELKICKSLFAGLLESLGPIRADCAPEVKEWQDAFRTFAWAVQALDVEMLAKAVKNLQETSDLEFREAQRLAETAVPVMRGYVDLNNPFCPLCPIHDPDTDWGRWALKISPLENWKFFNNFFWVSDGETREKGMPTIRMPSLFLHPELYKREYDASWHPIWGFTAFGAFKPHLKDATELLARVVGADAACWEAFRSGKAPAIKAAAEKWLETALLLLERPEAAVRGRAAYWFTRNSLFSEKPYDSFSARFLLKYLGEEKDEEVQRCILAALIYRNPFTRLQGLKEKPERDKFRLSIPEETRRRWPELVSKLFGGDL